MASLHSIEPVGDQSGTSFTCITEASSPYMLSTSFVIPLPRVCIHNFMSLQTKMAPPFKVTLYGVVQDVKGVEYTQKGTDKCNFDIVDENGIYISCTALGKTATSTLLNNNQRVVMYNASGRAGPQGKKGTLWLFKDAVLVPVGVVKMPPPKRKEISIQ